MKTDKYSRSARILHWISAFVIIWATLSGFFLASLQPGSELRLFISSFNVSLTTAFLPFFLLRMALATRSRKPAKLAVSRLQQRAAHIAHLSLYAITSTVLVSGILMMDHDISLFGVISLPNPISHGYWNDLFHAVHRSACMLLFLLLAVHIAAVVKHHRQGRKIMARMI